MHDSPPFAGPRKLTRRQLYKRRQAAGLICLKIEVDEFAFAKALPRSGRLTPEQALDRGKLAKAAAEIVADFIERWAKKGRVPFNGSGDDVRFWGTPGSAYFQRRSLQA